MERLLKKLEQERRLSKEEWICLIEGRTEALAEKLFERARAIRHTHYGNKIYIRGLIEFTNYCKNDCYYCGIRRSNPNAVRYRLTEEEILSCCREGYRLGFRTFVLQGGEDPYFDTERVTALLRKIRTEFPDCAITLSIGEKTKEDYLAFRQAGADRYLLRHETYNTDHYRKLHPEPLSAQERQNCLYALKEAGFQVGSGIMVGSPQQTAAHIAEDMLFLQELQPEMVGIGPFIPHKDTCFAKETAGTLEMTLYLLGLLRLMLPKALLPATTALATIHPDGRKMGILAGANVVMPNLSPQEKRKQYSLYDNKRHMGNEAAEGLLMLKAEMQEIGYEVVTDRGDFPRSKSEERE